MQHSLSFYGCSMKLAATLSLGTLDITVTSVLECSSIQYSDLIGYCVDPKSRRIHQQWILRDIFLQGSISTQFTSEHHGWRRVVSYIEALRLWHPYPGRAWHTAINSYSNGQKDSFACGPCALRCEMPVLRSVSRCAPLINSPYGCYTLN